MRISRRLLERLLADAASSPDREVCGLLFGGDAAIEAAVGARNISSCPENSFELDPATLLQAIRAERAGGARLAGCYHSHPRGRPEPSARDAADAAADGRLWLVIGSGEAQLWRAVQDGAHLGRFDPVALSVIG